MSYPGQRHRGAPLPYTLLAGVVPCPAGWLTVVGRLQGVSLHAQDPEVFRSFTEVLDYKPALQVVAVHAPIGLLDEPAPGGRPCDREARRLLGRPRAAAVTSPPTRPAVASGDVDKAAEIDGGMNVVTRARFAHIVEITREVQPYWQRTVFEVHPELSFYQLNDDRPLRWSKRTAAGAAERRALLAARIPSVERVLDAAVPGAGAGHLTDAAAALWTARRLAARAVARVPADPEWDSDGLRREIVR